jgi:hypothetical protein
VVCPLPGAILDSIPVRCVIIGDLAFHDQVHAISAVFIWSFFFSYLDLVFIYLISGFILKCSPCPSSTKPVSFTYYLIRKSLCAAHDSAPCAVTHAVSLVRSAS